MGEFWDWQNIPIANPCVYTSICGFRGSSCLIVGQAKNLSRNKRHLFSTTGGFRAPACAPYFGQRISSSISSGPGASDPDASRKEPQTPRNGKPRQEAPAEAGGPTDNVGPYAIPKKKAEDAPPPPPPVTPKRSTDMPDYSLKVNVPLVNVDVLVTTKDGQFVPGLKTENFRVLEDGVPQQVSHFNVSQAPITAVLLVEFASTNYVFMMQALQASYAFANTSEERGLGRGRVLRHAASHPG